MASKTRTKLNKVVGKDLRFIDRGENFSVGGKPVSGTWMYTTNHLTNENKHFFVPYDGTSPFRVFLHGKKKVYFNSDRNELYSSMNGNYELATEKDLQGLVEFEGFLRLIDPAAEIQGRSGPSLIQRFNLEAPSTLTLFPKGFHIE